MAAAERAGEPRRRLTGEARRAQLLEAALAEFASRGYHGTQMEHVAARAGVSKALLYQHFPSKDELFGVVTAAVVDTYVTRLPGIVDETDGPLQAWTSAVQLLAEVVEQSPESWALVARYLADPELGVVLRELRAGMHEVLAAMLVGYWAGPDLAADDVRRLADQTVPLVVGALQGLMSWWLDHPDVPRGEVVERAVAFGWLGLDRMRHGEALTD